MLLENKICVFGGTNLCNGSGKLRLVVSHLLNATTVVFWVGIGKLLAV